MPGLSSVACLCRGVCLCLSPLQTPGAPGEGEDGPCGPDKHPGTLLQYFESASARCCTLCCAICTTQQKAKAENNQGGHGHLGRGHHLQCQGRNWREGRTRQHQHCLQQGTERSGSPWKPESSWRSGRAGEGAVMSSFTGYFPLTSSEMPGWSL